MAEIWVISEGSPGHDAQSMGLAKALQQRIDGLVIQRFEIERRCGGVKRFLARLFMGAQGRLIPAAFRKHFVSLSDRTPLSDGSGPDLIISSGGQSVFLARHLSHLFESPFVFVGERKPYPSEWFDMVFTPSSLESGPNDVAIDLIPTGVTPKRVAEAACKHSSHDGAVWAMVIGGASRSHKYSKHDWLALSDSINRLSASHGVRWLLTTSRRTGAEAETILRDSINNDALADAIWWAHKPEKKMLAYLGTAEQVFVTQDSVTMVSECVSSAKPVSVVYPSVVNLPPSSFLDAYMRRLENAEYIRRIAIGSISPWVGENIQDKSDRVRMVGSSLDLMCKEVLETFPGLH